MIVANDLYFAFFKVWNYERICIVAGTQKEYKKAYLIHMFIVRVELMVLGGGYGNPPYEL